MINAELLSSECVPSVLSFIHHIDPDHGDRRDFRNVGFQFNIDLAGHP
jgi:hypothetical protein